MINCPPSQSSLYKMQAGFICALLTLVGGIAACGGESQDDASDGGTLSEDDGASRNTLSIIGADSFVTDLREEVSLRVRYHDSAGEALAGTIQFNFVGGAAGASIESQSLAVTPAGNGSAQVRVRTGTRTSNFEIRATVVESTEAGSASAQWSFDVVEGWSHSIAGTYEVHSIFDATEDMPSSLGSSARLAIDIADDPGDPAKWILEQMDHFLINPVIDLIAPILNTALFIEFPWIEAEVLTFGRALESFAEEFGIVSSLRVRSRAADDSGVTNTTADHAITGFEINLDGTRTFFPADNFMSVPTNVRNIPVEYSARRNRVSIASHNVPIPYGGVLANAIEAVVVPSLDPTLSTFRDYLESRINCDTVASVLVDELSTYTRLFYRTLCVTTLRQVADQFMENLREIDERSQLILSIEGEARAVEVDGDSRIDELFEGKWGGSVEYSGETRELPASGRPFYGNRE